MKKGKKKSCPSLGKSYLNCEIYTKYILHGNTIKYKILCGQIFYVTHRKNRINIIQFCN